MPDEVQSSAIFSAIPLRLGPSFDDDQDDDISLLTLQSRYQFQGHEDFDSASGFIFGLRSGFSSQLLVGLLLLYGFDEKALSIITENWIYLIIVTLLWSIGTVLVAAISSKLHKWMNQRLSDHQVVEQEFHLFHGSLIGMYLAWVLFDLVLLQGLFILSVHTAVALVGHVYLQQSKKDAFRSSHQTQAGNVV